MNKNTIYMSCQYFDRTVGVLLIQFGIEKKFIKIMHVVSETLPHLSMKFSLYFAHFCVCIGEFFYFTGNI